MKPFLERLAGGRRSFRDLGMGETAAPPKAENAEGARLPRKQVAEKTSPGALERKKGFHGLAYFN